MTTKPILIILAIDGADYEDVRQGIAAGFLPSLRKLAEAGAWGPLRSTVPPVTNMAWPSIFTGMNPGKHGIFNFVDFPDGNRSPDPVFMSDCKAPTFWHMLNEAGCSVGVWRLPWGFPAEIVDGYVLCDKSPDTGKGITWPDDLLGEIRREAEWFEPWSGERMRRHRSPKGILAAFSEEMRRETDLLEFCATSWPTDVVLFGMSLIDLMGHQFRGCGERAVAAMREAYRQVDQWVGAVLDKWAGPDTTVAIVSDHGMGPMATNVNVLRVLADRGFLSLEDIPYRHTLPAVRLAARAYWRILLARGDQGDDDSTSAGGESEDGHERFASRVDWSASTIVPWGMPGMLWLNRSRTGEAECQEAASTLRYHLRQLRHPQTGLRVIEDVVPKEGLYWGPHVDGAPDLVVVPSDGASLLTGTGAIPGGRANFGKTKEILWNTKALIAPLVFQGRSWGHRPLGVFMLSGPGVSRNAVMRGANVVDVTPTLLHALRLPIPADMDGCPRIDAFTPRRLIASPITFAAPATASEFAVPTTEEDGATEGLVERLRGMGYL